MTKSTFSVQVANKYLTILQGYSKTIRLLLVMFLTLTISAEVWGATWEKATSIAAGDVVLLVCESKNVELNGISTTSTKYGIGVAYTTSPAGAYELTVEAGSSSDTYSLKNGSTYLYWNSGNSLATNATKNANTSWSITFSNGSATIKNAKDNTRIIGWNASSPRFACYTSSQTAVQLYKKVESTGGGGGSTPTQLDAPTGLTVGNITSSGATLSWSAVANASSYIVTIVDEASLEQDYPVTGTTKTVNDLTPSTDYLWTVTAVGDGINYTNSEESETSEFTTSAPAGGGGGDGECSWTLVTDASTLKVDDEVIITASGSTTDNNYALSTNQKSNNRGGAAITKNGNTLTAPSANVQILTLKAGSTSGTFAFYTGTSGYLYAASSSGNQLKTKTTLDVHGSWTISITDGVASIVAEGSSNRNVMQYNYNNSSPLFACYASASQTSLAIYKKVCTTETSYSVTAGTVQNGSIKFSKTGEGEFTDPQLTGLEEGDYAHFVVNPTLGYTLSGAPSVKDASDNNVECVDMDGIWMFEMPASNVTVSASCTLKEYKITIDDAIENGTASATHSIAVMGTSITLTPKPATGYQFKSWNVTKEGDETITVTNNQFTMPASDVTVSAEFTPIIYTITYKNDEHINYTSATLETITIKDTGFELEYSVEDGYELTGVTVTMGGEELVLEEEYLWDETYMLILPEIDVIGNIVVTFETVATCTQLPTISAATSSDITQTTAMLSCSGISSLGSAGCSIESYGFVYGTSSNPTISNTKVQVGTTYTTTGTAFSKEFTSLTANTTYYVRPYATNGNGTAYGTQTSFKTLELPKYTVTLNAGPGNVTPTTITETSAGEGVSLPTPTIDCGDWEFAGWATSAVATETSSKPATLLTGSYKPSNNITLYAVYQRTEETEGGGGTEDVSKSYTFSNFTAGTQYAENEVHKLDNDVTLITTDCHFTSELRMYSSSTHNGYVVSNKLPGRIISIGFNAGNKVDDIDVFGSTSGTDWTKVGQVSVTSTSYKDYTLSFGETDYTYFKLDVAGANQVRLKSITITWESSSAGGTITTTYYNSNPVCQTCENVLTISKGTESNGTFTLSKSDEIKTCDGVVDVLVTPTPAEHYHIGSVTTTTPATGGAPTMTDNGDGTWTVTYAQNSTGVSTINVDFVEDAKATIILSELGETTTDNSTYYVGEQYTLPTTSSQSCEGKVLVGWSTVEVVETDTKPTENYYELGAEVTLEAEQTFYAVFAKPTGNGGAQGELFSESFNTMNGKGGNDGIWNSISSSTDVSIDGWSFTKGYVANQCIRLGTGSVAGQATTPALGVNGSATLTFKAGAWNGNSENLTINLQIVGEGSVEPSSITLTKGQFNTYTANITGANADTKVKFSAVTASNNRFFLDEVKVSGGSSDSYTDYSTSCGTYTITFYGFNRGGCTTTCGENPAEIEVAQGATYTIPNCVPNDPAGLGRTFAGTWNTQADGQGSQYKPGDGFTVDSDITLYAQWILKTTEDIVLPTDVEDLATTDIVVTGGTTLTLQEGTTTINSLTLEGGRTNEDYLMPAIYSDGEASVELNNQTIPFDLSVDKAHYYPFAVPFPVAVNQVDYADPTLASASVYGTHYVIKRYDGANRANMGENKNANWVKVEETETLQPGIGYIITAVPIGGEALIRFPMSPEQLWLSEDKTVDVEAHTGAAAQQHSRHAGWNFIANPYLSRFAGVNVGNENNLLNGVLNYVNGEWQTTGEVPYVTIPAPDFTYYEQVELDDAILSPSYAFFVQAAQTAALSFATTGRQQNMPALRAAARGPLRLPLTISQSTQSDRTTLLVSDDYTTAYEIGKDLEKMFGSAEYLSMYSLMANQTPLAFCATSWSSAVQSIPLGYRTNKSGSVTIALDASVDMSDAEMVFLYDAVTGMTTNLLLTDYVFETETGTFDARFTITITPKQGTTTDCEEVMLPTDGTYKFLRNGQLYINHRGTVYTVEGRENSRVRQ